MAKSVNQDGNEVTHPSIIRLGQGYEVLVVRPGDVNEDGNGIEADFVLRGPPPTEPGKTLAWIKDGKLRTAAYPGGNGGHVVQECVPLGLVQALLRVADEHRTVPEPRYERFPRHLQCDDWVLRRIPAYDAKAPHTTFIYQGRLLLPDGEVGLELQRVDDECMAAESMNWVAKFRIEGVEFGSTVLALSIQAEKPIEALCEAIRAYRRYASCLTSAFAIPNAPEK